MCWAPARHVRLVQALSVPYLILSSLDSPPNDGPCPLASVSAPILSPTATPPTPLSHTRYLYLSPVPTFPSSSLSFSRFPNTADDQQLFMSFAAPCTPCVLPHPQLPPFVLRVMEAHPTAADVVQSGLSIIHNLIISEPGPAVMALIRPCIPFTLRALRQFGDVEKVVAPAVVILQITSMVRLLLACA
jgi:hypothetical protein